MHYYKLMGSLTGFACFQALRGVTNENSHSINLIERHLSTHGGPKTERSWWPLYTHIFASLRSRVKMKTGNNVQRVYLEVSNKPVHMSGDGGCGHHEID